MFVEVKVVEFEADEITVLVPDKELAKRSHTELYHEGDDGNFVRQLFHILKRKKCRECVLLRLTQVSAAKSAEMRQFTRVPTDKIRARFGDEDDCRVIDISARGFAILSSEHAEVGASVRVVLQYNGTSHTGTARVVSVRESEPGSFRYGMCCDGVMGGTPDNLSMALPRIAMELQLLAPNRVVD